MKDFYFIIKQNCEDLDRKDYAICLFSKKDKCCTFDCCDTTMFGETCSPKGHFIGDIRLKHLYKNRYETHSFLFESWHNKGLGIFLYTKAINFALSKGFKISSARGSSREAVRVWKSKRLTKIFSIKKLNYRSPNNPYWMVKGKNYEQTRRNSVRRLGKNKQKR